MSRLLITCILVSWFGTLCAQRVVVKDGQTLEPLSYVTIFSKPGAVSSTTDASGRFSLADFPDGDSLVFRYLGYDEKTVALSALRERDAEVLLRHNPLTFDEIVVAAARWEQDRGEVPFQLERITPRDVASRQAQTMADLLGASDRVFIQKSQLGGGSPMIRGFSANRVLLVVDGIRMNNAIFRSGNLQNVIVLDPHMLDEAEVIFGPASVSYGSDAIGGVMDFHTREAPLDKTGERMAGGHGLLRFATANREKTAHADVFLGGRQWAMTTGLTYSDFDDLRMGSHGPDEYLRPWYADRVNGGDSLIRNDKPERQVPTGYSQLNLTQKLRFQPRPEWDLNLGLHYSTTSDIPRYDRLIELRNGQPRSAEWYYGPQDWFLGSLGIRHRGKSRLLRDIRLVTAYQFMEESRHARSFDDAERTHRTEKVRAWSLNLDIDAPLSETIDLYYGAEALFNRIGSEATFEDIDSGETGPTGTRYPDGSTWMSYALYANLQADLKPNLFLMAGLRLNQVDMRATFDTTFFQFPIIRTSLSDAALTGSLGLVFHPAKEVQLQANFSTGFRAPNIDDAAKVFDSEPGSVVVPNPGLEAEYAYSGDLGIVTSFGSRVRFDLSFFHIWLDNAMVRRDFTLDGRDSIFYDGQLSQVQAIQNVARARVWGLQAGIDLRLPAGFSLASRISWQDGAERELAEEEDFPVRHVAPLFGATHLRFSYRDLNLDLNMRYNGAIPYERLALSERGKPHLYAMDEDGRPWSPSWYTLNLSASLKFSANLQVQVALENITDQRYRAYSSGIAAPGRNLVIALRGTW